MYQNLAILAAFIFFYSVASKGLEKTPISGAIVFAAFGLVCGPLGLGILNLHVEREGLRILAELTLSLVLFTDAAHADLGVLKHSFRIPQRLLLIGLPLTIVLGFGAGIMLFDGLTLLEIAILATMLAPTDAALGKAVVTDEGVPSSTREGLNVESGLNDGICVPVLLLFLAIVARAGDKGGAFSLALKLVAEQIGIGVVVGMALTLAGGWLLNSVAERGWITDSWRQVPVPALAVTCFAVAQCLGGSGFIACFAGGLLFGGIAKRYKHELLLAAEGTGDTLALITWVVFGGVVIAAVAGKFSWQAVAYAVLSLTVVRMLPVYLALAGTSMQAGEKLFIGWFGPRGLASIVFAVIVVDEHLPGGSTIAITVVCTIALSVIAHGLSAKPLVALFAASRKRSR